MNNKSGSDYLVLQPDCSNKKILNIAQTAYSEGKRIVLCSIPDHKIRKKLLRYVSVAIFEEFQIGEISKADIIGLPSLKTAVLRIYGSGVETVIVKMDDGKFLIFMNERFLLLEKGEEDLYKMNNDIELNELSLIFRATKNQLH